MCGRHQRGGHAEQEQRTSTRALRAPSGRPRVRLCHRLEVRPRRDGLGLDGLRLNGLRLGRRHVGHGRGRLRLHCLRDRNHRFGRGRGRARLRGGRPSGPGERFGNHDDGKIAEHLLLHRDHRRHDWRRDLRRGRRLRLGGMLRCVRLDCPRLHARLAERLRGHRGRRLGMGGARGGQLQRLLVVRVQPYREPLLRGVVIDPGARRDQPVPDAHGQLLHGAEDGLLAWSDFDPVHESVLCGGP